MPRGGTRFWLWFCFFSTFFLGPPVCICICIFPTQKFRHLIAHAAGELYATRVHRTVEEETTHLENKQIPKIWISTWKGDCDHLEIPIIVRGFSILWLWYISKGLSTSGVSPKRGIESGVKDSGPQITVLCPTLSSIGKRLQTLKQHIGQCIWYKKILKWLLVDCFQIGHVWVHVEVKEAKSKARLGFPKCRVGLKRSQVECVVLHLA